MMCDGGWWCVMDVWCDEDEDDGDDDYCGVCGDVWCVVCVDGFEWDVNVCDGMVCGGGDGDVVCVCGGFVCECEVSVGECEW